MRPLFLLRWSARDLRRRWLQVAAIALIIAIGSGIYAALGSTATWRQESNDASFDALAMYDLRVRAAEGVDVATGELLGALERLPDPGIVDVAEERLVLPTQVDASTAGETILVPGRVIGADVAGGGPHVNATDVRPEHGRDLTGADAGENVVVLERSFAEFYDLPPIGTVRITGDQQLDYVGYGQGPEYFLVITEEGGFFAEANFAALFTSLETAQRVTGHEDRVNDLVLRLRPGLDAASAAPLVELAFADAGVAVTVMQREDEDAYRVLYDDIKGDQRFWNVFAGLILAGAAFGAFNLASRMVEAQRREIGIGMALGATTPQLAMRPLLVGLEIAVLGAGLGVAMGVLVGVLMRPLYLEMLPLPVWHTALQPEVFLQGAALGFVLPLVATAWPVWRAVRVVPVDAIATTHRSARGGLSFLLRRLPRPLSAFRRMPLGNVLRTPRRTLLTALGIGAAVATLVAILGMLDSFISTMDRSERELLQHHPNRLAVALDGFADEDGPEISAVRDSPIVDGVEPVLRVGATSGDVDLLLEVVDMASEVWAPTIVTGDSSGLVLAEKAAADLGVEPGDMLLLEHPARRDGVVAMVRSEVPVSGVHPGPFRFNAYLDRSHLPVFGAAGLANQLYVVPAAGATTDDVIRSLFHLDGVTSVVRVAIGAELVRDALDEFTAVFRILEGFILLLALLMAYNATSINADERARERATLFAFGLRTRRILLLESAEGVLIGILGTAVGIGLGAFVVRWLIENIASTTMPDLALDVIVSWSTMRTATVLGIVAVALAPLLTARRLTRMDIPGTLRVVE